MAALVLENMDTIGNAVIQEQGKESTRKCMLIG
jgi:hypothetical protein